MILLLLYAVAMLDRQILILMADPIRTSLHIGDFEIGLLHGFAFVLFYATCAIPLGWVADHYSRRMVIFAGVLIWSVSCAASGLARSTGGLFVARMGVGFGEAALLPAAFSLIAQNFPERKLTTAMAVFSCGGILGGGLTTAIGGLIADYASTARPVTLPVLGQLAAWQIAFILIALPGVPMAFLAFLIPERKRQRIQQLHTDGPAAEKLFPHIWTHRGFYLRHFFAFGLVMMLGYALLGWTPVAMVRDFGWPLRQSGPVLGALLIATGLASLLATGRFIDWQVARGVADAHMRYYAYACVILAVAGSSIAWVSTAVQLIVAYVVIGLIIPCIGIANAALQIATPDHLRGRVSALFLFVGGIIGAGMGTTIVGAATDYVFKDPLRVRDSMALVATISAPLAALLFWRSLKPFVRAINHRCNGAPTGG